jgi:hypothetical protein
MDGVLSMQRLQAPRCILQQQQQPQLGLDAQQLPGRGAVCLMDQLHHVVQAAQVTVLLKQQQ